MTTYALKSAGHYYKTRYSKITGGVIHILVSADDWIGEDTSADAGVRYGQTTKTPVSWHGCVDSDSTIDCLPDEYTAYHCYGYNSTTLGMELGAKSTDWTAKPAEWVEKVLARMAAWWAPRVIKHGIPIRYEGSKKVIDAKIARGEQWGFTDHAVLNPDTRTDPGWYKGKQTFPWARFLELLRRAVNALTGKTSVDTGATVGRPPLTVDGLLGPATISRWQEYYGMTPDGVISRPDSLLVRRIQKDLVRLYGLPASFIDGSMGPATIKALQKHYGTTVDGVTSEPSQWVTELQHQLNKWGAKR